MNTTRPNSRLCATCASWLGGSRALERGMVRFDGSPRNTGQCTHPQSGKTRQQTKPQYVCSKWSQAFS